MVRKTQIKKKKSKSQLRKTLKHYSKTNKNKKGGGWDRKSKNTPKNNQTMTAPPVNTFANAKGVKINPLALYKPKRTTFKLPSRGYNNNLPEGFVRNNALMEELYGNKGMVYNTAPSPFEIDTSYTPMYPLNLPKKSKYYNLSNTAGEKKLRLNRNPVNSYNMYSSVSNNNSNQYLYVGHPNNNNETNA